jgi:hypothetical protein
MWNIVFEYDTWGHVHNTSFLRNLGWPNKLDCYITQGRKSSTWTNTSLLGPLISYEENFVEYDTWGPLISYKEN